jgi:hypothetical protein
MVAPLAEKELSVIPQYVCIGWSAAMKRRGTGKSEQTPLVNERIWKVSDGSDDDAVYMMLLSWYRQL